MSYQNFNNPYRQNGGRRSSPHVLDLRKLMNGAEQKSGNYDMYKLERKKRPYMARVLERFFNGLREGAVSVRGKLKSLPKAAAEKKKERMETLRSGIKRSVKYIEKVGEEVEKNFLEYESYPSMAERTEHSAEKAYPSESEKSAPKAPEEKGSLFLIGFRKNVKVLHGIELKDRLEDLALVSAARFLGYIFYLIGKAFYRVLVYIIIFFALVFKVIGVFADWISVTTGWREFCQSKMPWLFYVKARIRLFFRAFGFFRAAIPKVPLKRESFSDFSSYRGDEIKTPEQVKKDKDKLRQDSLKFFDRLSWPLFWRKGFMPALGVAVIAAAIILPPRIYRYYNELLDTKGKVMGISEAAYGHLKTAKEATFAFDLDRASDEFKEAERVFSSAQKEMGQVNIVLQSVVKLIPRKGEMLTTAQNILETGKIISELGQDISESAERFSSKGMASENFNDKLKILQEEFSLIAPKIKKADRLLSESSEEYIPEDRRAEFVRIKEQIASLSARMDGFLSLSGAWVEALGEKEKKRYLVVFQNSNEIRPTGGFMGSFALVDLYKGEIRNIEIPGGGPYDLKGGLKERVRAPEPMYLVNSRWQFQDSNWFPDFPESAKKMIWFYEKSGGPSVDGVVVLNVNTFVELLKITGPIRMDKYDKTITAYNFILETQKAVELEYDKEDNKPKQFIADLTPIMLDRLFKAKSDSFMNILSVFLEAARKKDIQFYFNDEQLENSMKEFNWAGEVRDVEGDYLAVINTNIAGGKTDGVISQTVRHFSEIQDDGSVIDTVVVTRTHNGKAGDLFSGVRNVDYMRIYVPKGSELLEAGGFDKPAPEFFKKEEKGLEDDFDLQRLERNIRYDQSTGTRISDEFDKTAFGNWTQVYPGKSATVAFKYKLPFKVMPAEKEESSGIKRFLAGIFGAEEEKPLFSYDLTVQKQSGSLGDDFVSNISYPASWNEKLFSSDKIQKASGYIEIKDKIDEDKQYTIMFSE